MGFNPYEPQSLDPFTQWAAYAHREIVNKRKVNYSPDVLVSHTTQGVFIKPKPCTCTKQDDTSTGVDVDRFEITWRWTNGGGEDPEIIHLLNAEASPIGITGDSGITKFFWNNTGVRLKNKLRLPKYIAQIDATLTPVYPENVIISNPDANFSLTELMMPKWNFGSDTNYEKVKDLRFFDYGVVTGKTSDDLIGVTQPVRYIFSVTQMQQDDADHYYGGVLSNEIVDNAFVSSLGTTAKHLREVYIPPGVTLAIKGYIRAG